MPFGHVTVWSTETCWWLVRVAFEIDFTRWHTRHPDPCRVSPLRIGGVHLRHNGVDDGVLFTNGPRVTCRLAGFENIHGIPFSHCGRRTTPGLGRVVERATTFAFNRCLRAMSLADPSLRMNVPRAIFALTTPFCKRSRIDAHRASKLSSGSQSSELILN